MAISLKDYTLTAIAGLYISNSSFGNKGKRYICRIQHNKKKYLKVIGYEITDSLNLDIASKKFRKYKDGIVNRSNNTDTPAIKNAPYKTSNCFDEFIRDENDYEFFKEAIQKAYQYRELQKYQHELIKLQDYLENSGKKMIVLFEGRDASGKGGAIRRITRYMNNKHYRVVALGKPTPTEKTQWYFQRYIQHFPAGGEMVLYDRSWYNRAMVEPVFGFCTKDDYKTFMEDVVGFEKDLTKQGIILLKLYFSVSKQVQQARFDRRADDPLRQWKLSEVDVQAQGYWDEFTEKKYKMLSKTHSKSAPWIVLRSDNKFEARKEAIKHILNSVDYTNRDKNLDFTPNKEISVTVEQELKLMKKDGTY